jgi:hypothetical protein
MTIRRCREVGHVFVSKAAMAFILAPAVHESFLSSAGSGRRNVRPRSGHANCHSLKTRRRAKLKLLSPIASSFAEGFLPVEISQLLSSTCDIIHFSFKPS